LFAPLTLLLFTIYYRIASAAGTVPYFPGRKESGDGEMKYRKLGSSHMEVSVVSLGTWVLGGDQWGEADDKQSIATIQSAIDLGINLIDTAPAYGLGHAEEIVGKAIKGRRDRIFIASKCGLQKRGKRFVVSLKPHDIRKELEDSLLRMGIETIDLYQCHWPDPNTPIEWTLEEMQRLQSEGKISALGVSNFDVPLLEKASNVAPVTSVQPQYSLLERDVERALLPFCTKRQIGVMTYGSLGGGILTGKYEERPTFKKNDARNYFYRYYREPLWRLVQDLLEEMKKISLENGKPIAQVAINWILERAGVTTAIVGARTPEQVAINADASSWVLPKDDVLRIDQAYQRIFAVHRLEER